MCGSKWVASSICSPSHEAPGLDSSSCWPNTERPVCHGMAMVEAMANPPGLCCLQYVDVLCRWVGVAGILHGLTHGWLM